MDIRHSLNDRQKADYARIEKRASAAKRRRLLQRVRDRIAEKILAERLLESFERSRYAAWQFNYPYLPALKRLWGQVRTLNKRRRWRMDVAESFSLLYEVLVKALGLWPRKDKKAPAKFDPAIPPKGENAKLTDPKDRFLFYFKRRAIWTVARHMARQARLRQKADEYWLALPAEDDVFDYLFLLTAEERLIAEWKLSGSKNKHIAEKTGLPERTISRRVLDLPRLVA